MDADGGGQVNVTKNPTIDHTPAWSPDGRQIAFTSYRTGDGEVFVASADGSNPTNYTNHPADDSEPDWQAA
jgi:TolB protein